MLRHIDEEIAQITGERADPSGAASVPIGRHAQPNEIAELVVYLAADAPMYMTGAALSIDGGLRV